MNIEQIIADLDNGIMVSRTTYRDLAEVAREMQTTLQEIKGAAEPDAWSAMLAQKMLAKVEKK
jgi:hypothetical protein